MSRRTEHESPPTSIEHRASRLGLLDRVRREGGDAHRVAALRLLAEVDLELALGDERHGPAGRPGLSRPGEATEAGDEPVDLFRPGV